MGHFCANRERYQKAGPQVEARDPKRILPEHRLQSKIRDPSAAECRPTEVNSNISHNRAILAVAANTVYLGGVALLCCAVCPRARFQVGSGGVEYEISSYVAVSHVDRKSVSFRRLLEVFAQGSSGYLAHAVKDGPSNGLEAFFKGRFDQVFYA